MKNIAVFVLAILLSSVFGAGIQAQTKTVKIKQEKTLPEAHEFIITWEGDGYKATYLEVKAVLEAEPMIDRHVFFNQLQRISAIVKNPWTFDNLKALFEAHGFVVVNKADPALETSDHN